MLQLICQCKFSFFGQSISHPENSSADTSAKSIICQIRNLKCSKSQEQLQGFNWQREYKCDLQSRPHRIPKSCFFQDTLTRSPKQQNRKRNKQHQILNTLRCKISGTIISIFPDPPVSHHIRKWIHPHIPVQQRTEQDHGCIKSQEKQFSKKSTVLKKLPPHWKSTPDPSPACLIMIRKKIKNKYQYRQESRKTKKGLV